MRYSYCANHAYSSIFHDNRYGHLLCFQAIRTIPMAIVHALFCLIILAYPAYSSTVRQDGAINIITAPSGASVQNPAFSPDGKTMIYTLFHEGYNKGPAAIYSCPAAGGGSKALLDDEDARRKREVRHRK